jgi:hypothetical protein
MGWVILVIGVLVVIAIAGWFWWSGQRDAGVSGPVARRSTDEVASGEEPAALPIVPPPSGAGVPVVPLVPTFDPDADTDADADTTPPGEPDNGSRRGDDERLGD